MEKKNAQSVTGQFMSIKCDEKCNLCEYISEIVREGMQIPWQTYRAAPKNTTWSLYAPPCTNRTPEMSQTCETKLRTCRIFRSTRPFNQNLKHHQPSSNIKHPLHDLFSGFLPLNPNNHQPCRSEVLEWPWGWAMGAMASVSTSCCCVVLSC